MMLVVGLSGLILTAAASLTFGLMQLKTAAEAAPQESEHIANIRRFLEFAFSEAEAIQNVGETGSAPETPVAWCNLPGSSDLNEFALAFRLPGDIPLFMDDQLYLPAVDCYLRFLPDEGLYLFWQTDAMADEDIDDLRRTRLSPLVDKIEYLWYDPEDERWDISEEMEENDEGANVTPDFIRLTFQGDKDNPPTALLLLPPSDDATPRL
ncbi:hypothetical protein GCM10007047_12050 [Cerasicoccus arenae]|uniref:Uncharacterized protein n=2 Tax=Cerasicoccus arenae TaxID=424488 RepID=A0A8J3DAN9_9BACT|nr:hypothetical protein GCM10007047_12050 [Cerasicoccus arenae]